MKKLLMLMVMGSFLMAGCNPDEIPGKPYDGANFVYFYVSSADDNDPANASRITVGRTSSTAAVTTITRTVLAVGQLMDNDRTFKITAEIDPLMDEGFDITKLIEIEEDTYTIKGGETSAPITFKVLNDSEYLKQFKGRTIVTNIKIAPTDDFSLGFEKQTIYYSIEVSTSYQ